MTELDDHDLWPEPDDRAPVGRHMHSYDKNGVCAGKRGCGRLRDEAIARRNRANASRGKRIQRQRIVGLGGQNLPGNKPNHDGLGLAFSYESKSAKPGLLPRLPKIGTFPESIWAILRGIPARADQTRVLIVTEAPGPGHKARSFVVVEYDEWRALHGE